MMMKMKYGEGEEEDDNYDEGGEDEDDNDDELSWNNPPQKNFDSCCLFLGDDVLFF